MVSGTLALPLNIAMAVLKLAGQCSGPKGNEVQGASVQTFTRLSVRPSIRPSIQSPKVGLT